LGKPAERCRRRCARSRLAAMFTGGEVLVFCGFLGGEGVVPAAEIDMAVADGGDGDGVARWDPPTAAAAASAAMAAPVSVHGGGGGARWLWLPPMAAAAVAAAAAAAAAAAVATAAMGDGRASGSLRTSTPTKIEHDLPSG
jgi:hypothetical protein